MPKLSEFVKKKRQIQRVHQVRITWKSEYINFSSLKPIRPHYFYEHFICVHFNFCVSSKNNNKEVRCIFNDSISTLYLA